MNNKISECKCSNCVYYKPNDKNFFVGKCNIDDNPKNDTEAMFCCHRWITNEHKYGVSY